MHPHAYISKSFVDPTAYIFQLLSTKGKLWKMHKELEKIAFLNHT